MVTNQELREIIEEHKQRQSNTLWAMKERKKEGKPLAGNHCTLSQRARLFGGGALRFGETTEARRWFAEAALRTRAFLAEFVERHEEIRSGYDASGSQEAKNGLYAATLAGDERLINTLVSDLYYLIDNFPESDTIENSGTYWIARTVAALIDRDINTANNCRKRYKDDSDLEPIHAIHGGLVDNDPDKVQSALNHTVRMHAENVESMRSWNQPIAVPGCVHIKIANHIGMDIWVDSDYVPDGIREYNLNSRIDLPHPEYVDEALIPA